MTPSPTILQRLRDVARGKKLKPAVLQELAHDGYLTIDEYKSPQFTPKATDALRRAH